MRKFSTKDLTLAAMVAALYAVMGYFGNIFGLTFGPIQFRFAEGCLIVNLLSPYGPLDIVVGSAATLIAAVWTSKLNNKWLAPLPPVLCNTVLVGFTIGWAEANGFTAALPMAWLVNGLSVGVGELGVCYLLGMLLLELLPRIGYFRSIIPEKRLSTL